MTRRELQAAYDTAVRERRELMEILVAIARDRGPLNVKKSLVVDQQGHWIIQTEPFNGGEEAMIVALKAGNPGTLVKETSRVVN